MAEDNRHRIGQDRTLRIITKLLWLDGSLIDNLAIEVFEQQIEAAISRIFRSRRKLRFRSVMPLRDMISRVRNSERHRERSVFGNFQIFFPLNTLRLNRHPLADVWWSGLLVLLKTEDERGGNC